MAPSDVHQMLEDEYKLLAQCDGFKKEFDRLAERFGVNPIGKSFGYYDIYCQ